jgi:hypothetical protein
VRRSLLVVTLLAAAFTPACESPDPAKTLELKDLETYWAIDSALGDRQFIAPVARFQLRNTGKEPLRSVEATATFRRKGEEETDWGSAWQRVTPASKPLAPGSASLVLLKSDGRYYSSGEPQGFFANPEFKDAVVTVYLRVGSSAWSKFAEREVERRIGTKALEAQKP